MKRAPRVLTQQRGRLGGYAEELAQAAAAALESAGARAGLDSRHELSLVLCDNAAMRVVNRRWRGMDKATDVLSFPLHELQPGSKPPAGALGDILISLPTARKEAKLIEETAQRHVERLAIHGLAHLLGYDHHSDSDLRLMERKERQMLGRTWKP